MGGRGEDPSRRVLRLVGSRPPLGREQLDAGRLPPRRTGTNGAFAQAVDIAPSGEVWTLDEDLGGSVYFVRWSGRIRSISEVYTPPDDVGGVDDIAATSRTDLWAVGSRDGALESPLVVHWNGTSWRTQPTPFDALKHRYLNAITAVSPTDIWAVGNHLIVRYSCSPGPG